MVSIYLAAASLIVFSGLVIKRSFSQRQIERDNRLRREATRIAIGWMESEETAPYFRDLNGRKKRMLVSVIAEIIPTIRGDVRTKMIRFIVLLGGVEALVRSTKSHKPDTRLNAVSLLQYFRIDIGPKISTV